MNAGIIDSHCHFWGRGQDERPKAGDWRMAQFRPEDLAADFAPLRLCGLVHVETGACPERPWHETQWLKAMMDQTTFPYALIGQADLCAPDLSKILEAHLAHGPVRGIRMRQVTDFRELSQMRPQDNIFTTSEFARGVEALDSFGLHCELQAPYSVGQSIAPLAKRFQDTKFILKHFGFPSPDTDHQEWRRQLTCLQDLKNVYLKASGIQMLFGQDWKKARALLEEALEVFGAHRLLFGSNLPVDSSVSHDLNPLRKFISSINRELPEVSELLFRNNALKLYRLGTS